jgi:hypothetical protein
MAKKTKALSGASQDAYFRRLLGAHPNLSAEERDRIVHRLREEIAQLRLRTAMRKEMDAPPAAGPDPVPSAAPMQAAPLVAGPFPAAAPAVPQAAVPFDPFSPNVIVVVRKAGRDAALAALGDIDSADNLRLLAREQRLAVPMELSSAAELRIAIVTAAERRIANRVAAAT